MPKIDIYHENKMHSQGGFPFNIYICHMPKNILEVCNHHHIQYEIIAIKSGMGYVFVNLEKFFVQKGDVIFVPKNTLHAISQKDDVEMSYETIIFEESLVLCEGEQNTSERFPTKISVGDEIYASVESCITKMDKFSELKTSGYELMVKSALTELFYHLNLASCNFERKYNKTALGVIKKVVLYISEHFAEDITVMSVACEMGYSKSRFMAVFKEYMGTTFTKYLSDIRLGNAKFAILNTSENITDIAQNSGFSNISYFNRLFKEKYSKSPSQLRRESNPSNR